MPEESEGPSNLHLRTEAVVIFLGSLARIKNLTRLKLLKIMSIKDIRYLEGKGMLVQDGVSGYYTVFPTWDR